MIDRKISGIAERRALALELAKKSQELILGYYQSPSLQVELKRDRSVVTAADKNAEILLREEIKKHFPDDAILGEEFGEELGANPGKSDFRWILDPVDGTQSFVCGVPLFGTLIGITHASQPVFGLANFPALNEIYWGTLGEGAWWKPSNSEKPLRAKVSEVSDPKEAIFCTNNIGGFEQANCTELFHKFHKASGKSRGWSDCYGHALVASGRIEIMVDPLMNLWDNAALFPITTEAGGHFFDLKGQPRIDTGSGISCNAKLFDHYRKLLI